jgi:ribosomal protein L11 methyltransferase
MKCTLRAAPELREPLTGLLVDWGAQGVQEEGDALLVWYTPDQAEAVEAQLGRYRGDTGGSLAWEWERIEGEDWWEAWKAFFKPVRVSPRLLVCPSWEKPPLLEPQVKMIRIDPGRAFGTGGHETTRLCLELIDQCLSAEPVEQLLDVGTGSGILTVGARLLGVNEALAMDIDPMACEATGENLRDNGVEAGVEIVCGDLRGVQGQYPLVVANILYQIILGLAPMLAERTEAGGRLIISGLLAGEGDGASRRFADLGLEEETRSVMGDWCALLLRKR